MTNWEVQYGLHNLMPLTDDEVRRLRMEIRFRLGLRKTRPEKPFGVPGTRLREIQDLADWFVSR